MHSRWRIVLYILGAVIVTASISVALTITIMNGQAGDSVVLEAERFQAYNQLNPLLEIMDAAQKDFYGADISRDKMIDGALRGAVASLGDPYARYYTEQEYESFLEQLNGSYYGIGVLVGQPAEDGTPVLKVYEESPAAEAGLLPGDIITHVNGTGLAGLAMDEVERLFMGPDGEAAALNILRGGQTLTVNVTRKKITTQRVDARLFNQYTGYIRIDKFSGTAEAEFTEALRDLADRGMRSLVVDLRNNPGGDLEQVIAITDQLVGEGVIVRVQAKGEAETVYKSDAKCTAVPLAVLVNENSASASEILAAAVKENGRGLVVGVGTYGKGVVQTTARLESNGGWIKMTTAAYYTPDGGSVDGAGVQPDIEVDLSADLKSLPMEQIDQEDDAQLWAALDEVRSQADEAA